MTRSLNVLVIVAGCMFGASTAMQGNEVCMYNDIGAEIYFDVIDTTEGETACSSGNFDHGDTKCCYVDGTLGTDVYQIEYTVKGGTHNPHYLATFDQGTNCQIKYRISGSMDFPDEDLKNSCPPTSAPTAAPTAAICEDATLVSMQFTNLQYSPLASVTTSQQCNNEFSGTATCSTSSTLTQQTSQTLSLTQMSGYTFTGGLKVSADLGFVSTEASFSSTISATVTSGQATQTSMSVQITDTCSIIVAPNTCEVTSATYSTGTATGEWTATAQCSDGTTVPVAGTYSGSGLINTASQATCSFADCPARRALRGNL